mgnify:FL=1
MQASKVRSLAFEIFNDLYSVGENYVKHKTIYTFFKHFFKPRVDNIILVEASEAQIKEIMWKVKRKIDNAFKEFDLVEEIMASKTDKKLTEKLMKLPDFADLEALLE